jgi:hypothetical protein
METLDIPQLPSCFYNTFGTSSGSIAGLGYRIICDDINACGQERCKQILNTTKLIQISKCKKRNDRAKFKNEFKGRR